MSVIYKKIKAFLKKRQFDKRAIYGKNTKFDFTSYCKNNTGYKNNLVIGDDCFIRCGIRIEGKGRVVIGNRTYIGDGTVIGSLDSVFIGNDVIIAGETHIYDNNNHPIDPEQRLIMSRSGDYFGPLWQWNDKVVSKSIVINDNVWIRERCSILKGTVIGRGAIVGCNSVVTKDVPPYSIVAGNPARVVKYLDYTENLE